MASMRHELDFILGFNSKEKGISGKPHVNTTSYNFIEGNGRFV